ncbi:MAG: PBP1A family penicillin-binding protein [Alphaproteobacteria bacterium]|nr:PBP1A family penicillin-binding protein [Alphaproteobacteria bacterium]
MARRGDKTGRSGAGQRRRGGPRLRKGAGDEKKPASRTAISPAGALGGRSSGKAAPKRKSSRRTRGRRGRAGGSGARRSVLRRLLSGIAVVGVWGLIALIAVLAYFSYTLPDVERVADSGRKPGIFLNDVDGNPVLAKGDLYGDPVDVARLPPYVPRAIVAIEDRRFYEHDGIDPIGLARALWVNIVEGGVRQGGSTITQQLAKNVFLTPERSIERKIREALLAFWLEWRYDKNHIISLYLNRVYFGSGAYGIDAAARRFFSKPAGEVDLWEAAVLAGLLKAPSRLSPVVNPAGAGERGRLVLRAMADAGFISAEQAENAAASTLRTSTEPDGRGYFADWVLAQVDRRMGLVDRDLRIATTFDPGLQRIAAETAAAALAGRSNPSQVALVAMSPDGAVRAMVGGRDYGASQFNRATQAVRQPGSAFKLFVYMAALERGLHPDDIVTDARVDVGGWAPRNFDGRFRGSVTMREAFAQSLNAAAVRLADRAGRARVAEAARRLGIASELAGDLTIALGSSGVRLIELTGAYAAFANGGAGVIPYGVQEIAGVFQRTGTGAGEAVAPGVVASMNDLLMAVVTEGTGKAARLADRPAAGKTGTSQSFRDAFFVGFTGNLVAGVWVGNDDGAPMDEVTGGGLPARIWHDFMTAAHEGAPVRPIPGIGSRKAPYPFRPRITGSAGARPDPSNDP